jgi:hypothetical protein
VSWTLTYHFSAAGVIPETLIADRRCSGAEMHFADRFRIVVLLVASLVLRAAAAGASDDGLMQDWLKQTDHQGTIAPGTKINIRDWQQYRQFMLSE